MLMLRLVLMVMFARATIAVAIMLMPIVTFLLESAVRILALFLAAQAGDGVLGMRGHGVLTESGQPDRHRVVTRGVSCGTG
ncbi:hypothetical protein PI87_22525 [Ralstonia sp. A12]|nr:hypothetical protein PI87_22525 [Ralstonia sp. A12]